MAVSTLIIGFALQYLYHCMVIAVFFATQMLGIIFSTIAIDVYLLNSFQEG